MKSNQIKSKNMMAVQQLKYLPNGGDVDKLYDLIEGTLKPKRFALIVHDKDFDESTSKIAEPHVHIMLSFLNARSISNVAKTLGIQPQQIAKWDGKAANGFAYLVHRTKDSSDKYQYNPIDVSANFDYPKELEIYEQNAKNNAKKIKMTEKLDDLYNGKITREELEDSLTGALYARYKRQIDDIYAKRLTDEAKKFRKKMIDGNIPLIVIWIYGQSGLGKTRLAKKIATDKGNPWFISGSSRDLFQNYNGEHTIILDELRPDDGLTYRDMLRLLDPYGFDMNAPSRYRDKAIAADLIIITSPFTPKEFYDKLFHNTITYFDFIDSFNQLLRRISVIINVNSSDIHREYYDSQTGNLLTDNNSIRANPFAVTNNNFGSPISSEDIYNRIKF